MLKFLLCIAGFLLPFILAGCGSEITGPAGATGPTGAAGTSGTMTVTSSLFCSKIRTVNSVSLYFTYTIINYSTGGVLATCGVSGPSAESSDTSYYSNTASNDACITTFDVDAATGGFWNFTFANGAAQTVYTDGSSASNNTTVTMTCQ